MGDGQVTRGYGLLEGFLARKRAAMANRLIPPACRQGRILDIGCGTQPYFLQHTEFAEKVGVDQVITAPHKLEGHPTGITLLPLDLYQDAPMPFPDGHFSAITMLAVVEHLPGTVNERLCREIYRILQPEGVFILTTPAPWSDGLLRFMAKLHLVSREELDEHQTVYGPPALHALLHQAGFAEDTITTGYFELALNLWAIARISPDDAKIAASKIR